MSQQIFDHSIDEHNPLSWMEHAMRFQLFHSIWLHKVLQHIDDGSVCI